MCGYQVVTAPSCSISRMGAAWIHADLGRLFAKLGPKGTQAGLEVVDGVSVDGHARNWHAGGHPLLKNGGGKSRALVLLHRQILSFQAVGTDCIIYGCQEKCAFRNHQNPF